MSPVLNDAAPAHKPRNKLRKLTKLRPGSTVSNSASPRHSSDSPRNSNSSGAGGHGGSRTPQSPRTTLPLPPDLSDSKWLEYIRQSGYLMPMEKSPRLESAKSPMLECTKSPRLDCAAKSPRLDGTRLQSPSNTSSNNSYNSSNSSSNNNNNVVPEFAHLSLDVPTKSPRRSPERQLFPGSDLPTPSSLLPLRRHPKPPVIRLGQLEAEDEAARADEASSVELIADQYKAILESRNSEELRADASLQKAREDVRQQDVRQQDAETRQASVDAIRGAILRRRSPSRSNQPLPIPPAPTSAPPAPPAPPVLPTTIPEWEQPEGSPTSDGTLVAFEEDAIYFKPVSYSPEALSPIQEDEADDPTSPNYHHSHSSFYNPTGHGLFPTSSPSSSSPQPPPPPRPDVLSLQIAMDLLTRELSAAVSGEGRPADDVRSLQVWVMIEAYERLRDQVLGMTSVGMPAGEVRALMGMFNMWIRALHGVYERIRDRGVPGLVGGGAAAADGSEALQLQMQMQARMHAQMQTEELD